MKTTDEPPPPRRGELVLKALEKTDLLKRGAFLDATGSDDWIPLVQCEAFIGTPAIMTTPNHKLTSGALAVLTATLLFHTSIARAGDNLPTFTKITTGPVGTDMEGSSGFAWFDADNDNFLDLYVANRAPNKALNSFYHNNGRWDICESDKCNHHKVGQLFGECRRRL